MLETRSEYLLKLIMEDYIQTAEPVGSLQLAQRHALSVSSATIRNEMAWLESEGFLRHPHTSSGRVPTEKAYLYYLQHFVEPTQEKHHDHEFISQMDAHHPVEYTLKTIAKHLVGISGETAIVASDAHWSFYAGLSNLLTKPEFEEAELRRSIPILIDQFDEVIAQMYNRLDDQTVVYIGSKNPFGDQMTTILVKYRIGNELEGLLGLVGPIRMNYQKNIALVEEAKELITELYA